MALFKRYLKDESGQFAIMFAVVSTMLLSGVMVAVDIGNMVKTKTKVAAITDSAALAGANMFDNPAREEIVLKYLEENSASGLKGYFNGDPIIQFDDASGEVSVSMNTTVEMAFADILGFGDRDIHYKSVAGYPNTMDPLTIAFALDVSGSMGGMTSDGVVKLAALKDASSKMFEEIEGAVRNKASIDKYVRTGLSAFHNSLAAEHAMSWGFVDVDAAIQGLTFGGSTNTLVALENAHKQILDDRAFRRTANPGINLNALDEFVIFMTDGSNTASDPIVLDEDSYQSCVAMREDGIEVFAVAFTAPAEGQLLLMDCASLDDETEDRQASNARNERNRCGQNADERRRHNTNNDRGRTQSEAALENCRDRIVKDKKEHYFDAADAQSFEEIFKIIGQKINESAIRIKS